MNERYDYIIVGGGPAGCVLAGRLSENPRSSVLLIEAGRDVPPDDTPANISDAGFRAHFEKDYFSPYFEVDFGPVANRRGRRRSPYRHPWVLGGGSSVNGMHAQRGTPSDWDHWVNLGVEGWGWNDVLPFFRKCETDADFANEFHGQNGPLPIERVPRSAWSAFALGLSNSAVARGVPLSDDLNAPSEDDGVGAIPLNKRGDRRVSATAAYLGSEVRNRPNLTVWTNTEVVRLVAEGKRIVGVELRKGSSSETISAAQVIVSAGALRSPALLLRSGIGPAAHLRECGIKIIADRPGVGASLRNHIHLSVGIHLRKEGRLSRHRRAPCAMVVRYSSKFENCEHMDMILNVWERFPGSLENDPLGRQIAMVMLLANKTYSSGSVTLDPTNPFGIPRIDFNILDDMRDVERMASGLQFISNLLSDAPVSALVNECVLPQPTKLLAWLTQYNLRASAVSRLGAVALGASGNLAKRLMRLGGQPLSDIVANRETLIETVHRATHPAAHATTTCRMGSPKDKFAVTDSECRVIGVEGLRVVDGSIFPSPLRAGTHLPIIMAAEKIAAGIMDAARVPARSTTTEDSHA